MAEDSTPVAVARAFTEAWTSHNVTTAARYLADDVTFEGPANRSTGADAYMQGLNRFASSVTGMKVLAALGDDAQAMIMYEVTTPAGAITCAELLTVREGKIHSDRLTFSTNAVPAAQSR
jgi:hypothetical protein